MKTMHTFPALLSPPNLDAHARFQWTLMLFLLSIERVPFSVVEMVLATIRAGRLDRHASRRQVGPFWKYTCCMNGRMNSAWHACFEDGTLQSTGHR